MGKIFDDIDTNLDEKETKNNWETFESVTNIVRPRTDILHREKEIARLDNILGKRDYRSVLLVGDKGIGKFSIVEGFSNYLYKNHLQKAVYELDYNLLCESITTAQEFSTAIKTIMDITCETPHVILNINHFGHILNNKIYGNGGYSFMNTLATYLQENDMKIIATTTSDEYDEIVDSFPHILDYFTVIHVNELDKDETEDIIKNELEDYGDSFSLIFTEKTPKLICENADKYVKDRPFPEKARWLLDEVCSNVRTKKYDSTKIIKLIEKAIKLKDDLKDAVKNNDYKTCESITNQLTTLEKKIEKLNNNQPTYDVNETDVLEAIGEIVGVNMSILDKNQTSSLQKMGSEIKKNVIGQDEAVDKLVKNIIRNKLGLRKSTHSMGNFIFIGSTGVGKTHLAKKIAEQLYGSEEKLLRFDMSEYQSEIDVNKLLGSPPGYVGYKESGQLVKKLDKNPESVVLFDEIEKAHPKIYDVLLQLLDEGFITGSDGNKVDATKSLIIFTSNIGVRRAKDFGNTLGFTNESNSSEIKKEEIIRKALKKRFSPEFLNRLDGICYFNNLNRDTLKLILKKEMEIMNENIQNICGKTIELSKDVETWILDKVEEEENGARPIIRHLQQNIEEELSTMIVEDSDVLKKNKKSLTAHIKNDKIILK